MLQDEHSQRTLTLTLTRLLATPGGPLSLLANGNHLLFLFAYLEGRRALSKSKAQSKADLHLVLPSLNAGQRLQAFADLIATTRTNLRLLGLFTLYAWLRQLMSEGCQCQPIAVYAATLAQCAAFIVFQSMESLAFLVDKGVLPLTLVARWGKDVASVYRMAYRAWLAAIVCGLVRIGAELSLRSQSLQSTLDTSQKCAQQRAVNWHEKIRNLCATVGWMPVATHCSLENGLPCFNTGLLGVCGLVADFNALQSLWNEAK